MLSLKKNHWPVRTGQVDAPWRWIGFLALPWASMVYFEHLSSVALTFKVREFVSTPVIITLIGSFNLLFNIGVGAGCNYASDRIWTRHGRRKPFLIVGWLAVAIGCLLFPTVETLCLLVVVAFVYEMLRDLATPYESLCNEVVPPHQRGRANAAFTFARQGMIAFFFAVMIGRWDEVQSLPWGGSVSGEQLVFWTGSLLAILASLWVYFGVREVPPDPVPPGWPRMTLALVRGALAGFFRNVFGNRQWRALYAVAIAQMIFWIDLGSLGPLLYTEQWGFSKQIYGNLLAISTVVTLFVFLPLGGWLADRTERIPLFQGLAAGMMLSHLSLFLFIKFVAPEAGPPFAAVLIFKLISGGIGTLGTICSVSLMFDYVPRSHLGTVLAGVGITRGFAAIMINNGNGLWVTGLAMIWPRSHTNGEIAYDYASGYLYLALCGVAATGIAIWFARETRSGRLVKLGVLEAERLAGAVQGNPK